MNVTSKALWYIESHLSGEVSLEAIADAVGGVAFSSLPGVYRFDRVFSRRVCARAAFD